MKESTYISALYHYLQYLRHAIKLGLFVLYFLLYELFFLFAQVHLVHFDHELVPSLLLFNLFVLLPRVLRLNVGFNTFGTLSCTISWLDLLASCCGLLLLGCSLLLVLLLLRLAGMLLHPIIKRKKLVLESRYSITIYLRRLKKVLLTSRSPYFAEIWPCLKCSGPDFSSFAVVIVRLAPCFLLLVPLGGVKPLNLL